MSDSPIWDYINPVHIVCAPLDRLGDHVQGQHVLLVTTPGFVRRGIAELIKTYLAPREVTVWEGVRSNPDLRDLDSATELLREKNVDFVVGLGGGSALDAAKVLATTLTSPARTTLTEVFRDGKRTTWHKRLPLIAIPTTSGTGAEVTPFATVWDRDLFQKNSLSGDFIYPDVAFLDVKLTLTLSEEDTLYPALDAISHALESLWNNQCTPISRAFAFQALALSNNSLPLITKEPNNLLARQKLQNASVLAGLAISQTRTAIAHSISYPLTIRYGVPHGLACSFTLPFFLAKNSVKIAQNSSEKEILDNTLKLLNNQFFMHRPEIKIAIPELENILKNHTNSHRLKNYKFLDEFKIDELLDFLRT